MRVTNKMVFGSILGGALLQLAAMLACGNVSTTSDARAATDGAAAGDAAAVNTSYAGFSYHTNAFVTTAGWGPIVVDVADFNTFGASSYGAATGTFTAPMAGYYRFTASGFSPTMAPGPDTRIAFALNVNGASVAMAGGQLSQVDSPLPVLTHVVHLSAGDAVSLQAFTPVAVAFGTLGSANMRDAFYFQGELVGQ